MNLKHKNGNEIELYAAYYFTSIGWRIYWPLLTQSREDFIISNGEIFKKVQVKKATWSKSGKYKYLQCRLKNRNKFGSTYNDGDFDIIVFIDDNLNIWMADWLEIKGLVSVCLQGSKDGYLPQSNYYNPNNWKLQ